MFSEKQIEASCLGLIRQAIDDVLIAIGLMLEKEFIDKKTKLILGGLRAGLMNYDRTLAERIKELQ